LPLNEAARLSDPLSRALAAAEARYRARHPQSARLHERACRFLPGGSTRSAIHHLPFPLTWQQGRDQWLIDVDGHRFIDLLGEYSAGLYGHSDARIQAAIQRAVEDGLVLGGPNRYEAHLAEALCTRFPSIELVRFTNSGTEANLMALATARAAAPGRRRVLVFEGGYHGGVLNFRRGHGALTLDLEWCIGHYNAIDRTRELIRREAHALAAVLVEPMQGGGCIPGEAAFLGMLREVCTQHEVLLIFDEVMTSRLSPAGLQGILGLRPDLTTLGKYLGGGASFGAFGGRRDLMQRFDTARADAIEHAGTFNNNVLSMAAGLAGLTEVYSAEAIARLNGAGDALRERLNAIAVRRGAALVATGIGSFIGLHLDGRAIPGELSPAAAERRSRLEALFHLEMLARGFHLGRRGFIALSMPIMAADLERFALAVDALFKEHAALFAADAVTTAA
jgi:glutamate-1-semialdehyde 2,1-aminomutase